MSGGRKCAARWRRWLGKTPPRSCLHAAHWEREARHLPVANRATTRWWMRGGGECAAECVATGAARRRRGQHVALNVVCRRGMRAEAEGSCTSKHSALEGGEGGLDADHACEALQALTRRLQGGAAAAHCCMTLITKAAFAPRCEPSAQAQTPNPFAVLFLRGGSALGVLC